jgi:hypothetical protein
MTSPLITATGFAWRDLEPLNSLYVTKSGHVFPGLRVPQFKDHRARPYILTNSLALVRERTIPTKRPPLVGDVSANFGG